MSSSALAAARVLCISSSCWRPVEESRRVPIAIWWAFAEAACFHISTRSSGGSLLNWGKSVLWGLSVGWVIVFDF